jgi:hypothetical protein
VAKDASHWCGGDVLWLRDCRVHANVSIRVRRGVCLEKCSTTNSRDPNRRHYLNQGWWDWKSLSYLRSAVDHYQRITAVFSVEFGVSKQIDEKHDKTSIQSFWE